MGSSTIHTGRTPRRTFLLTLGLAAGAAAVDLPQTLFGNSAGERSPGITLPGGADAPALIAAMPRIGILVPGAGNSGYSGEHVTAGISCYLDELLHTRGVKTTTIVAECDARPHVAAKQAATLIESGTIDVLVAPLDASIAASVHPLLEAHNVLLVNIDAGANIVRDREQRPMIVHSTLGHWEAMMELGRHAATTMGKNVMISSSLYESGYDSLYAFRLGVEAAGGTVVDTHITHSSSIDTDMKAAVAQIAAVRPDVVCAMYTGTEYDAFMKHYTASGVCRRIPLVTSGFAVDSAKKSVYNGVGAATCMSWSRGLESDANNRFIARYDAFARHRADCFSVLGYDTATLIGEAVRAAGGRTDGKVLAGAITDVRFDGPRGSVTLDPSTRATKTPVYLCAGQDVRATAGTDAGVHPSIAALQAAERSGFTHSYLTL